MSIMHVDSADGSLSSDHTYPLAPSLCLNVVVAVDCEGPRVGLHFHVIQHQSACFYNPAHAIDLYAVLQYAALIVTRQKRSNSQFTEQSCEGEGSGLDSSGGIDKC